MALCHMLALGVGGPHTATADAALHMIDSVMSYGSNEFS